MDDERISVPNEPVQTTSDPLPDHYIETQTSLVERSLRNLKNGDAFAVLDSYGDIGTVPDTPEGLFFRDTRYLSYLQLEIDGKRPLLLGSVIQDDNASLTVDLTNPDLHDGDGITVPRDIVSIERTKFLWKGACYERIGLRNFDTRARTVHLAIRFDADFRDLFEVRGSKRDRRGRRTVSLLDPSRVAFRYDGLDDLTRITTITFAPAPATLQTRAATYAIEIGAGGRSSVLVTVACSEGEPEDLPGFMIGYRDARRNLRAVTRGIATVEGSNTLFNEVVCRSTSDIYMLVSQTVHGLYPYAGIPWFSTVFGRDGIITAMLLLWVDADIAKGVLKYLAATQATTVDPAADAQPGKILHERRHGEMALLGEVPFRLYYGTVDATPLFVMLAGMYFDRTGDRDTIKEIWPQIEAALDWCDTDGDRDKDGFVEYFRETESGLANQGWKDSQDSIFHADGSDAVGPIALCEVQGYVYAAKRAGAELAQTLGHHGAAARWANDATTLQARFEAAFWCEEIGTYALALDGAKRPCRVRSSNAGHALFTGIASPARAARVAETLMGAESFSGWGIRTIAQGEPRYNPMSYHNGSIWPHDNALIALGFARYDLKHQATQVFEGMFGAASYQELRRLPELFCGFLRRPRRGPTSYPVACAPQAWAAAAPFGMLQACLGLNLDFARHEMSFTNPRMPDFLDELLIRSLSLGSSRADIRLRRDGPDVTVSVRARQGDAHIIQSK